MRTERHSFESDAEDNDLSEVHSEIASIEFDERLLPLFEERQRHAMALEKQRQEDDARTVQLLITESASITKRGQFFSWTLTIGALIGGVFLITIGQEGIGVAVLFGDASFVAINTLRDQGKKET